MSEKMPRNSGSDHEDRTTPAALESLVSDIMDMCSAPSSKRHDLERLLSRHMKQDGDFAVPEDMLLSSAKRNSEKQIHVTGPKSLQLKFSTNISQPVFTGVPIKGKDQPLKVELIDTRSGKVVKFGPEASARVEIAALEADFGGFLSDNWSSEEFKNKIITKEGNKRLLTGNLVLYLNEGIGFVDSVQFSHTKTWKTKRAYRLGAMATHYNMGIKIKEGFTDSFEVKDHRLDLNKKHYPPKLSDEVWRLESIARDGAFHQRLSDGKFQIITVEDLLKIMNTDPNGLRDILGKGMYAKNWEALVNHARTCIIDERLHFYSSSGSSVLFNTVGEVMGLFSESQYFSFEMLSETERAHARNLVASAFQQWDNVISFNDEASFVKHLGPTNYHLRYPVGESSSGINILIPPKNNEFGVPQSAISFDDKASLFDESPGPSNIVYTPKSPTMENFDGNNIIITNSPNFDELDFPQPAISFEDKKSLFNESTSLSKIVCPPKSFIQESSSGTQILISQENEFDLSRLAFYSEDDDILFDGSPGPSNIISPAKSPFTESSIGCNNLSFHEIDEIDLSQLIGPSLGINSNRDSVWDMNYYNDYNSSQRTDSEITDFENWEFCEGNIDLPLQFSVDDVPIETDGLFLESIENPQNEGNNGPLVTLPAVDLINNDRKQYLRNKARRKWRVLFTATRLLFLCRNAAEKLLVRQLEDNLFSTFQDLQFLDNVDSGHQQSLTNGGNIVIQNTYETKGFHYHAPVLSRNLSTNSEANLHTSVNNFLLARSVTVAKYIPQKKYMSKREKAQRRWTKVYSLMRWFSVQRNVTKKASYALIASSTSSACPFHKDEYVEQYNTFCSLQPRNCIAMNKLARRKNAAEKSFAKRKWKMLFSVMKWLSLRRKKGPYKNY